MQDAVEAPARPFGAGRVRKYTVPDELPREVKLLRGGLRSLLRELQRQELNLIEVAVPEERRFEVMRRQNFDAFGATERAMLTLVTSLLVEENRNGQPTDSDNRTV